MTLAHDFDRPPEAAPPAAPGVAGRSFSSEDRRKQLLYRFDFAVTPALRRNFTRLGPERWAALRDLMVERGGVPMTAEQEEELREHLYRRLITDRQRTVPWLNAARPLKGARILEIGCGDGPSAVALAEQGAEVLGVDIDERAIAMASARCELHGVQGARFMVANLLELPEKLPRASFDFVIFFASLEHMTPEERIAGLRISADLLVPGGILAVTECPNRLWWFDRHTSGLPFFNWLPDEIAATYVGKSPRLEVAKIGTLSHTEALNRLTRAGRGVSYHEFEIAFGRPVSDLEIISGREMFSNRQNPLRMARWLLSGNWLFQFVLRRCHRQLPREFCAPDIDILIRAPAK